MTFTLVVMALLVVGLLGRRRSVKRSGGRYGIRRSVGGPGGGGVDG